MDINQLEAFSTIAELQSFSKAAEKLYITQPAISKRIAALENTLDIKLFERFGQKIRLTEAGKVVLVDARDILSKVEDMRQHSDLSKHKIAGKLRIATSHHIGLYRLPAILKQFVHQYPEVQLDMHFTDSEIAYDEISQGLFDLAIATLPLNPNQGIQTIPLWQDELLIMFSQTHEMHQFDNITPDILARYPAVLPDKDTFTRRIIDSVFEVSHIEYQLAFTTNYLETIKVMTETGLGWSILPSIMQNNQLTCHPLPTLKAKRELGAMIHKNKVMTPALNAFLQTLSIK